MSIVTAAELERLRTIQAHIHRETCPLPRIGAPCPTCPTLSGLYAATVLLAERPRDARGARRALHDVVCMSGCGPDSDHADRTQARPVAALRKFLAANPVQVIDN